MRKKTSQQSEKGQSIVIMAFGMVVLLGFLALAVDGDRAYNERRVAQNAADASSMAAARELGSGASSVTAERSAYETASNNGYDLDRAGIVITDIPLNYGGTFNTGKTASYEVDVDIDSGVDAAFAQLIYGDFLDVDAHSKMEVILSHPPFAGFGLVSLGTSCSANANGSGVGVSGGGNSGGVELYGSTILINVPNPNNNCAFDPPSSNGNPGIFSYEWDGSNWVPIPMHIVGDYTCNDPPDNCSNLGPTQSGFNNGVPLTDPLANLPKPTCTADYTSAGTPGNGIYNPGIWMDNDLDAGTYLPGIYCIRRASNGSAFKITGGTIDASSGVLFFFDDTGGGPPDLDFGGNSALDLRAPGNGHSSPCDQPGDILQSFANFDTTNPCHYRGMAIFVDRPGPASTLELGGNGTFDIYGTVYGAFASFTASGGGAQPYEIKVHGQVITNQTLNDGSGSLQVWYDDNLVFKMPPFINALD